MASANAWPSVKAEENRGTANGREETLISVWTRISRICTDFSLSAKIYVICGFPFLVQYFVYFTSSHWLALWLLNSGAYMLWMVAMPDW